MKLFLSLMMTFVFLSLPALADPPGPPQCDWSKLKQSLGYTESGGRYGITNPWNYLGKYQFGEGALNTIGWYSDPQIVEPGKCSGNSAKCEVKCGPVKKGYAACYNEFTGAWTGSAYSKYSITSDKDFLANGPAQEEAFERWMGYNYNATKQCHDAIGRTITDRKGRTCKVTLSGILAGAHLAGPGSCSKGGGVCGYLCKGGGSADNATHVSDYICAHGNISVPSDPGKCSGTDPSIPPGNPGPGDQPPNDDDYCGTGCGGGGPGDPPGIPDHYQIISDLIRKVWVGGLQLMAEQLTVTMMMQAEIVGTLFDAKHQMETERLFQQKTARAHKDYQPSEQMCTVGTFARNLANTDRRAQMSQMTLSQRGVQREMMSGDAIATQGRFSDQLSRFETYRKKFCNPKDNAGGTKDLCENSVTPDMRNKDIDFTRAIDMPLTLQLDVLDTTVTDDETTVFALMDNLFVSRPPRGILKEITTLEAFTLPYQNLRSVIAMRSIARNSFNNIIAQKSYGPEIDAPEKGSNSPYLRAFIKEMGITDEAEVTKLIGERPSYWAQMEILTKKIYQHPNFTVNLYDKPANVARIRAAMKGIKVMQDRDIYEALVRREMLISILTELAIRQHQERISSFIVRAKVAQ